MIIKEVVTSYWSSNFPALGLVVFLADMHHMGWGVTSLSKVNDIC